MQRRSSLPDLPFSRADLSKVLPRELLRSKTGVSLAYFLFDVAVIAGLFGVGVLLVRARLWWALPLYWLAQGSMLWSLFLIGHDTGHGAFSRYRLLNDLVGHIAQTPVLVPYHAWRISHRIHHQNTGSVLHDESHVPMCGSQWDQLPRPLRRYRRFLGYTALSFPLYLAFNTFGRPPRSHYNPWSPMFAQHERAGVALSVGAVLGFVALLALGAAHYGVWEVILLYGAPYLVFGQWLILVTSLHHTDPRVPWYHEAAWDHFRGSLSVVDRSYGRVLDFLQHHIGLHVAHHLYPTIPHYHLRAATAHLAPVLGELRFTDDRPFLQAYLANVPLCDFVEDEGDVVFYQPAHARRSAVASRSPAMESTQHHAE